MFTTESGHRVWFSGDTVPKGVTVLYRDGKVETTWTEMVVPWAQPYPVVEVVLPDYEAKWREAHARLMVRAGKDSV